MSHWPVSVCIPAYNRPRELSAVLASVAGQGDEDLEVVVADDCSPRADEIEQVVRTFADAHPRIHVVFSRNPKTLGYDANVRGLLEQATGDYCFFMADDDSMMPGAIARVRRVIERFENIGVILRSWLSVRRSTGQIIDRHRYFKGDRLFEPGIDTVVTFFRRSVFISGYIVHRKAAVTWATDRFDGTLLYQLHLSANILADMRGYYISDYLTAWLPGGSSYFGTAEPERARFAPGPYLPEHMVNFVGGMLHIAQCVQETRGLPVYQPILRDIDSYAFGYLAKRTSGRRVFARYVRDLRGLGLGRSPFFWLIALLIVLLGQRSTRGLGKAVKRVLGRTPMLSNCYLGRRVDAGRC